jgi:hypothetical protein
MSTIEWKNDFVEGFVNQGRAEAKARAEAEAAVSVRINLIMKMLGNRDLHPTKKQLSRLAECTDIATLDRWLERSITAASAKEVFAD